MLNWEKEAWRGGINALRDEVDQRVKGDKPRTEPIPDAKLQETIREAPVSEDTSCLIFPVYHVAGTNHLLASLLGGSDLVLPEERKPAQVLDVFRDHEVTTIGGVQAQFKAIADHPDIEDVDTSSLRHLHVNALTSDTAETIREYLCSNICTEYASSEAGEVSFALNNVESIGSPAFLQEVRIVKPGTDDPEQIVDPGERGEIIVNADNPMVFNGYLNKPGKTQDSIRDGWYFTGDLVRKGADGELRFEGRVDNMIVSGGENIAPPEVEDALVSHPAVETAGVIGVEDEKWGERVVAFVMGDDIDTEELGQYLKESELADFKRPKEYHVRESLPMIETGGIDRNELRECYPDI